MGEISTIPLLDDPQIKHSRKLDDSEDYPATAAVDQ